MKLRAEYAPDEDDRTPPSVEFLRSLRAKTEVESDFVMLTTLLESECSRFGLLDECEALGREMMKRFPKDPMPWISFAGFLLHTKEDLEEAKSTVEIAVEKAARRGQFVRHAYNTRARIARRLGDFALLEDTLKKLTNYAPKPGSEDIDFEDDFLVDLPSGSISEDILREYRAAIVRSRKRR